VQYTLMQFLPQIIANSLGVWLEAFALAWKKYCHRWWVSISPTMNR